MKIKLLLIYISFLIFSCKSSEHHDSLKGSWYNVDEAKRTYKEIHIDDSLYIYCSDNCDLIIPFNYYLKGDSIYLFVGKDNVRDTYQILFSNSSKREMYLTSKRQKLFLRKMDDKYENLNNFLVDYESLDSLSYDYHQRKKDIMNSLKNP